MLSLIIEPKMVCGLRGGNDEALDSRRCHVKSHGTNCVLDLDHDQVLHNRHDNKLRELLYRILLLDIGG